MLIPLGELAIVDQILEKLEGFYGIVSSGATLMQTFYSDYQKKSESIVAYGTRLEQTLSRAVTYGHLELSAKDSILRSKFWTGLRSQTLKNSTRHLYDASTNFQSLLREIRKVESEDASCSRPVPKQKAQQQSGQAEKAESKEDTILSKLSELMGKMTSMERELKVRNKQLLLLPTSPRPMNSHTRIEEVIKIITVVVMDEVVMDEVVMDAVVIVAITREIKMILKMRIHVAVKVADLEVVIAVAPTAVVLTGVVPQMDLRL